MARTRVLIVDDSVVVRKVLTDALKKDPDVEVVGSAANGSIALQKITQVNPDVVILDVEMPDMDGVETVKRIRAGWPKLPVIMCSSLTERGADTTLRALANGASDYIAKPSRLDTSRVDAVGSFNAELLAKVKALSAQGGGSGPMQSTPLSQSGWGFPAPPQSVQPRVARIQGPRAPVSVLGIGCSTGGPNALATLFEGLPRDLHVPILIVQHMPPLFTKLLADRLAASSGLTVTEARGGDLVEPGCAYVAPGDYHMTVVRDGVRMRIALNQEAPENSCRPAVDVLFRSLSKIYGPGVLATVMTGMGQDGTRGARAIVEAGGSLIVQDAATCVVPSMPGAVAAAGLAEEVYPLDRLAQELVFRIRRASTSDAHLSRLEA
jgi:two-component system, chemotaxis family, protein-glutamate methylesterase/glutaminase